MADIIAAGPLKDRHVIAADAFWNRFTFAERVKLNVAQQHNPADSSCSSPFAPARYRP